MEDALEDGGRRRAAVLAEGEAERVGLLFEDEGVNELLGERAAHSEGEGDVVGDVTRGDSSPLSTKGNCRGLGCGTEGGKRGERRWSKMARRGR